MMADGPASLIWLALALPLAGAVLLLLLGRPLHRAAGWIASGAVGAAFVVALVAFLDLVARPGDARSLSVRLFDWISVGSFEAPFELRVDPLSLVMVLTVTGVSFLIHVYSIGYMREDPGYPRYFAYLNLFVFSMVTLVLANNFVVLYLGWEAVGLCSYLLIAFWYERKAAADAGKKAFIVNRIGDFGFALGIFLIFQATGSVRFDEVFGAAGGLPEGTATAISFLLLAGAVGKSAQLPLHVWLPDAMEGPTPVSALIHAATMVTAGVYLVVRAHVLFEASEIALFAVAIVGTVTTIYAATSALGQDDLKRVLAYSTISQLGFMFLAAGVGAYGVAIFHLVTHAFFKAVLFLGAGSVMHATGGVIDVKRLGGLGRVMPWTTLFFGIGGLALVGLPPLSGFFSKDQVLAATYGAGHEWLWLVVLVTAGITALYTTRAFVLTFLGTSRLDEGHPHESPAVMLAPMAVLAAGAAAAGLLGLSATGGLLHGFLGLGEVAHAEGGLSEGALAVIATAVAVVGVLIGWLIWGSGRIDWAALRVRYGGLQRAMARGWYVDDTYGNLLVLPGKAASAFLAYVFDKRVVDGAVNGLGRAFRGLAGAGRRVQTGFVRTYALAFLLGVVGLLALVVLRT
ncbi:MAG TPA: NADH-quinone oxidoreductase subunit L [Actinomycetota bacterium]